MYIGIHSWNLCRVYWPLMTKQMQESTLKLEGNAVQMMKCCKDTDKSVYVLMLEYAVFCAVPLGVNTVMGHIYEAFPASLTWMDIKTGHQPNMIILYWRFCLFHWFGRRKICGEAMLSVIVLLDGRFVFECLSALSNQLMLVTNKQLKSWFLLKRN